MESQSLVLPLGLAVLDQPHVKGTSCRMHMAPSSGLILYACPVQSRHHMPDIQDWHRECWIQYTGHTSAVTWKGL